MLFLYYKFSCSGNNDRFWLDHIMSSSYNIWLIESNF